MATANPDHYLISSSEVENVSVYDTSGNNIGQVDSLMIGKRDGHVRYALIGFGGLAGMSQGHYPVPWSALRYNTSRGGFETTVTEQQLKSAPDYNENSWSDRTWERNVHSNYGVRDYWTDAAMGGVAATGTPPMTQAPSSPTMADPGMQDNTMRGQDNSSPDLVSSEDVEGIEVYDRSGTEIGSVDHLMIEKQSGQVRYAVISFGGFLGLGKSHQPLPWNALSYDLQLGGFKTDITEQQLRDAPEFSDDSWTRRDWEQKLNDHYGRRTY